MTFDPYFIKYAEVKLMADLAGKIEVKSLIGRSPMRELGKAL
ncbi:MULTISPECIES: hypothetical protein [Limnospira]|uniref:Uncharacterized protein n=1 Tax=Limnospira fusiformis PMC 851.14 TaxID=2219512 RepID=A0ABU9EDY4_LIMFS|nr:MULTISPECIES: hypothetical protein [Limnospira]MDT9187710.1 hypothetical protein [Limnospira sp. PMC 894.15]MDT9233552.1 hypothetical protein [Limnospira sp. PMC 917.15]